MNKRQLCWVIAGLVGLSGCVVQPAGDEGTESHWLKGCAHDSDCEVGACLCGACTERCEGVADCAYPLDSCGEAGLSAFGEACAEIGEERVCTVHDERSLQSVTTLGNSIVTACDQGRATKLSYTSSVPGAHRVIPTGDGDFYAFYAGPLFSREVLRIDADGNVKQRLEVPSQLLSRVTDVIVLPTGTVIVAGWSEAAMGSKAWVGALDVNWNLNWETVLEDLSDDVELAHAPAGDFYLFGWGDPSQLNLPTAPPRVAFLKRFDAAGDEQWQVPMVFENYSGNYLFGRSLTTSSAGAHVVVPTDQGAHWVSVDDEGNSSDAMVELALGAAIKSVAELPDNHLAIASNREAGAVITVVDGNGQVVWEQSYEQDRSAAGQAIAYDPQREQILLGGVYRGDDEGAERTWMIATDLEGDKQWTMVRDPQRRNDVDIDGIREGEGPGIWGIAVDSDGTIVATGNTTMQLTYFVIGADECE